MSLPHPRQLLKRGPLSKRGRSGSFQERYAVRRFRPCNGTTHITICSLMLKQCSPQAVMGGGGLGGACRCWCPLGCC